MVKMPIPICRFKPTHHLAENCRISDLFLIHLQWTRNPPNKADHKKKHFNIKRKKMIGDGKILC
jgi:hypothetical protein